MERDLRNYYKGKVKWLQINTQNSQQSSKQLEADFEKFYDKDVGAAGTRVRKHCQDLAKLCKETRNDVTAVKNARKEAAAK